MPKRLTITATDWALLVILSVLWGGSFFFGKVALAELPPLTLTFLRVTIAAAVLIAVMRASGQSLPTDFKTWTLYALLALINNVLPFALLFWAQTYIASGLASILNATTPFFTIVVAHLATTDDKITPARAVGLLIGFAGVVTMLGYDLLGRVGADVAAELACLAAALLYGFAGVFGRRFSNKSPLVVSSALLTASSAILLPVTLIVDQPWSLAAPSSITWAAVIGIAVLSTSLAYILYFRILASAGATNLMLVTMLIPVSAILLGTFLLDETLAPRHFLGMAGIALGLAAIDGRPWQFVTQRLRRALAS